MNIERVHYIYVGVFSAGLLTGVVATHLILQRKYDALLAAEIEDVKRVYKKVAEKEPTAEIELEIQPDSVKPWVQEVVEERNLYSTMLDEEGYEGNEPPPTPTHDVPDKEQQHYTPYPISLDQWLEETGQEKVTLAYFIGDESVVDDTDRPVEDFETIIGTQFRDWFGYLSEDDDTVFIRNESLNMDIEVMREEGTYLDALGGY